MNAQNELIRGVGRQFESAVVLAFLSVVAPDEWSQGPVDRDGTGADLIGGVDDDAAAPAAA